MSGIIIDVEAGSSEKNLGALNKKLSDLVKNSNNTSKSFEKISGEPFSNLNKEVLKSLNSFNSLGRIGSRSLDGIEKSAKSLNNTFVSLKSAAIGLGTALSSVFAVSQFNKAADELANLESKLKLVTSDSKELADTQKALNTLAKENRTSVGATTDIYVGFARALEQTNMSSERLLNVVKTVQQAAVLSGATTESTKLALYQLNQGLSAGVIRGEEFNSIMEQMGYLATELKKEFKDVPGGLKAFAAEGKLTSEVFVKALEKISSRTQTNFNKTNVTVESATNRLQQASSTFTGELNRIFGVASGTIKLFNNISDTIDTFSKKITDTIFFLGMGVDRFISQFDRLSNIDLIFKDISNLKLNPINAYERYKALKEVRSYVSDLKKELSSVDPSKVKVLSLAVKIQLTKNLGLDTGDLSSTLAGLKPIVSSAISGLIADVSDSLKQNPLTNFFLVSFKNLTDLIPIVRTPIVRFVTEITAVVESFVVAFNAASYQALIPFARNLEAISEKLTFFAFGDKRLERAWVKIFESKSISDFTTKLKELNVVRAQIKLDDYKFVNAEIMRSVKVLTYGIQDTLIYLGIMDNTLFKIRDTRFDRLVKYIEQIGSVAKRVYQDIVAPIVEPFVLNILITLKAGLVTLLDTIAEMLSESTGERIGKAVIKGFESSIEKFLIIDDIILAKFSSIKSDQLFQSFEASVAGFGKFSIGFVAGISKQVVSTFKNSFLNEIFNSVVSSFKELNTKARDAIRSFVNKIPVDVKDIGLKLSFDKSDIRASYEYLKALFERVVEVISVNLNKAIGKVKHFTDRVKSEFFDAYDKVVGHSYWPDLIDEVVDYTGNLFKAEPVVETFTTRMTKLFKSAFTEFKIFANKNDVVRGISDLLSNLNLRDVGAALAKNIGGAAVAAIFALSGNASLKYAALVYYVNFFESVLLLTASAIGPQVGAIVGTALSDFTQKFTEGLFNSLDVLLLALPSFFEGFAKAIVPFSDQLFQGFEILFGLLETGLPNLGILLQNTLLYGIITATAALSVFSKDFRSLASDLIFGKENKKGVKVSEGVIDYIKALLPNANVLTATVTKVFENPKLAIAAAAAFASTVFSSISVFEAAQFGVPLLAFAVLGKDGGARLLKDLNKTIERVTSMVFELGAVFSESLLGKDNLIAKTLRLPNLIVEKIFGSKDDNSKAVKDAGSSLWSDISQMFVNLKTNTKKYASGEMSLLDAMLTMPSTGYNPFKGVGGAAETTKLDVSKNLTEAFAPLLEFRTKSGKSLLDGFEFISSKVKFYARQMSVTLLWMRASLVDTLGNITTDILRQSGVVISQAISLVTDGLKLLVAAVKSKVGLFVIFSTIFASTAFAAADLNTALGAIGTTAGSTALAIGAIAAALISLGFAYKSFAKFKEGKEIFSKMKAGTFVKEDISAQVEAFRTAAKAKLEGDIKSETSRFSSSKRSAVLMKEWELKRKILNIDKESNKIANEINRVKKSEDAGKDTTLSKLNSQFLTLANQRAKTSAYLTKIQTPELRDAVIANYSKRTINRMTTKMEQDVKSFEAKKIKEAKQIEEVGSAKSPLQAGLKNANFYANNLFDSISGRGVKSIDDLTGASTLFGKAFSKVFSVSSARVKGLEDNLRQTADGFQAIFSGDLTGFFDFIPGIVKSTGSLLGIVGNVGSNIKSIFTSTLDKAQLVGGFLVSNLIPVVQAVGVTIKTAILKPLWTLLAPIALMAGKFIAIAAIVGSVGLYLFGPDEAGFFGKLEWVYDKIKGIFGFAATTKTGRLLEIKDLVGKQEIAGLNIDYRVLLNDIDWSKMTDKQYQAFVEVANETKSTFDNLNGLFLKQGKLTEEQKGQLATAKANFEGFANRQVMLPTSTLESNLNSLNESLNYVDNSAWTLTKRMFGWKPAVDQSTKSMTELQKVMNGAIKAIVTMFAVSLIGGILGTKGKLVAQIGGLAGVFGGAIIGLLGYALYEGIAFFSDEVSSALSWFTDVTVKAFKSIADKVNGYVSESAAGGKGLVAGAGYGAAAGAIIGGVAGAFTGTPFGIAAGAKWGAAAGAALGAAGVETWSRLAKSQKLLPEPPKGADLQLQTKYTEAFNLQEFIPSEKRKEIKDLQDKLRSFNAELDPSIKKTKEYIDVQDKLFRLFDVELPFAINLKAATDLENAIKDTTDAAKTLFGFDFGDKGTAFIGDAKDLEQIKEYNKQMKYLNLLISGKLDLDKRNELTSSAENIKEQIGFILDTVANTKAEIASIDSQLVYANGSFKDELLNRKSQYEANLTSLNSSYKAYSEEYEIIDKLLTQKLTFEERRRLIIRKNALPQQFTELQKFKSAAAVSSTFYAESSKRIGITPEALKASKFGLNTEGIKADVESIIRIEEEISKLALGDPKIIKLNSDLISLYSVVNQKLGVTWLDDVNEMVRNLGGLEIKPQIQKLIGKGGTKALGEKAAALTSANKTYSLLREKPGVKLKELRVAKDNLDVARESYNNLVKSTTTDTLKKTKNLEAFVAELGNLPAGSTNTAAKLRSYEDLMLKKSGLEQDLAAAIKKGDRGEIATLQSKIYNLDEAISNLGDNIKLTFDTLSGALSSAGVQMDAIDFKGLTVSARAEVIKSASIIAGIQNKISKLVLTGKGSEQFASLMAAQEAQAELVFNKLQASSLRTGNKIQEAFSAANIADFTAISDTAASNILALNSEADRLKFNLTKAYDTKDPKKYLEVLHAIVKNQEASKRAGEDANKSLGFVMETFNKVFKTSLSEIDFANIGILLSSEFARAGLALQRALEDALKNTETAASAFGVKLLESFEYLQRIGSYFTLFSEYKKNLTTVTVEGVKSGFDRVKSLLPELNISFRSFSKINKEDRRKLTKEMVDLDTLEKALNLSDLTPELVAILDKFDGSNASNIMASFKTEFEKVTGRAFAEAISTPVEANTKAIKDSIDASKDLAAAIRDPKSKPTVPAAANPTVAPLNISTGTVSEPSPEVRDKLEFAKTNTRLKIVKETGDIRLQIMDAYSAIDKQALNLANATQLKELADLAERFRKTADKLNAPLPTSNIPELERSSIAIKNAIATITDGINEQAAAISEASKQFSSDITGSFSSALKDLLKGKADENKSMLKTFVDSVMNTITNSVIDSFVNGLLSPLTGKNGIVSQFLEKAGASVFASGSTLFGDKSAVSAAKSVLNFDGSSAERAMFVNVVNGLGGLVSPTPGGIPIPADQTGSTNAEPQPVKIEGDSKEAQQQSNKLGDIGKGIGALAGITAGAALMQGNGFQKLIGILTMTNSILSIIQILQTAKIFSASGGYIAGPGTSTSDSIPAMLSNGEFVINAAATKNSLPLLQAINAGKIPKFAEGGLVPTGVISVPAMSTLEPPKTSQSAYQQVINISITGDISRQTRSEIYKMLPSIAEGVNSHNREKGYK